MYYLRPYHRRVRPPRPTLGKEESDFDLFLKKLRTTLPCFYNGASRVTEGHKNKAGDVAGPYQNLQTQSCRSKRGDNYELTVYSEQGVTTEVYSEPPGEVSEGVIHMKVELEQY